MPVPFTVHYDDNAVSETIAVPSHVILRQARSALGMSLQQVADACGINIRQYQKFESGERDITGCAFATALRLCGELDLDPWLFLDTASPEPVSASLPAALTTTPKDEDTASFQRVRRLP